MVSVPETASESDMPSPAVMSVCLQGFSLLHYLVFNYREIITGSILSDEMIDSKILPRGAEYH